MRPVSRGNGTLVIEYADGKESAVPVRSCTYEQLTSMATRAMQERDVVNVELDFLPIPIREPRKHS